MHVGRLDDLGRVLNLCSDLFAPGSMSVRCLADLGVTNDHNEQYLNCRPRPLACRYRPPVAVDENIPLGSHVSALTHDIEGCLKPRAIGPNIAQCRIIPKGTRVDPKEPSPTNFILTCVEDGREPQCLYIPAEMLGAAQPSG